MHDCVIHPALEDGVPSLPTPAQCTLLNQLLSGNEQGQQPSVIHRITNNSATGAVAHGVPKTLTLKECESAADLQLERD